MCHTELNGSAILARNGDRKVFIRRTEMAVQLWSVRTAVEDIAQDLGDVWTLGCGRARNDADHDGNVLRTGERQLVMSVRVRGVEDGVETYRFVELDGDV